MGLWGRGGAVAAAICGAWGLYSESTIAVVLATLVAMASMIAWTRWTAPHDHWRDFRRKNPGDP